MPGWHRAILLLFAVPTLATAPISLLVNNTAYFLFPDSLEFSSLNINEDFGVNATNFKTLANLPENVTTAAVVDNDIVALGGPCGSPFQIYFFSDGTWEPQQLTGPVSNARDGAVAVASGDTVSIFGGVCNSAAGNTYYNSMDTISGSVWNKSNNINPPVPETGFTLTPINSTQSVIVGGRSPSAWVGMKQVAVYDSAAEAWSFVSATGADNIDSRMGHTVVSAANGTVIVYGGYVVNQTQGAMPQLLALDTTVVPYRWSSPTLDVPMYLFNHAAVMLPGKVMLLYRGQDIRSATANDRMLLLDTQTLSFIDTYSVKLFNGGNSPLKYNLSTGKIAAIAVAFTLFGLALALASIYLIRRRWKRGFQQGRRSSMQPSLPSIHPPTPPPMTLRRGASVKAWAETIARQASGMSPATWENDEADFDQDKMIQVVFSAPRGKLRITNPDPNAELEEEPRRRIFSFEKKAAKETLHVPKRPTLFPEMQLSEADIGSRRTPYDEDDHLEPIRLDSHKTMKFV